MKNKSIKTLEGLTQQGLINPADLPDLKKVVEDFSLTVSPQMLQLINKNDPTDPIARQFVPSVEELKVAANESSDPIGDDVHAKVKGIIHRYPDRCLFKPVHVCPVYCRFCFRKEKVGPLSETLKPEEFEAAYSYIKQHKEIWEVILTGGDPLMLKPSMLSKIVNQLCQIDHVEIIRIHTRVPVVDSIRINEEMLEALKCSKTIYVMLHANHPNEFTAEAVQACAAMIDAGIPMLSQTTLLKDINDNIETLSKLMRCFVKNRIKPYYLHQCDLVKGSGHFRTSIAKGQELMKQLRGRFSGLCQPTYILDIPGGHGKVPVGPEYLDTEQNLIEDYQGNNHLLSS